MRATVQKAELQLRVLDSFELSGRVQHLLGGQREVQDSNRVLTLWAVDRVIDRHKAMLQLINQDLLEPAIGCLKALVDDLGVAMYCLHCVRSIEKSMLKTPQHDLNLLESLKKLPRIGNHLLYIHQQLSRAFLLLTRPVIFQLERRTRGLPSYEPKECSRQVTLSDIVLLYAAYLGGQAVGSDLAKQSVMAMRLEVVMQLHDRHAWPIGVLDEVPPEPVD
jgi:hypothetical protein